MTDLANLHFTEYDTRVASYAVIVDRERVLLSWWNGGDHPDRASWTLPGGGVDFDEQIEDAAVREVHEETGYDAELTGFLLTDSAGYADDGRERPFKAVRVVFTARVLGGELGTLEVGGSTDRAAWIPLADLDAAGPRTRLVDLALAALRAR